MAGRVEVIMPKCKLVLVALAVLALSSLACGNSNKVADAIPEAAPDPVQVKYEAMKNAYELGETLFFFDAPQSVRYALFYGGQRIVFIKERALRGVKLTSNECLNLDIKKEYTDDEGEKNWSTQYTFQGVGPGDYVYFESGLWRVTHYTP
jgi:hypothetical protein